MLQADAAYVHRMARVNTVLSLRSAPRRAPSTSSGRATRVGSHTASRSDAVVSWWTEATALIQPAHEQEACPLPLTQRHAVRSVQLVTLLLLQGALVPGAPLRPGERVFGGRSCCRPSSPSLHRVPPGAVTAHPMGRTGHDDYDNNSRRTGITYCQRTQPASQNRYGTAADQWMVP